MADAVPVVAPKEALAFFRSKGLQTGFAWQDIWQEEHARSFTVAKAMSRDLLEDIRGAVDQAMAEGTTLADFRRGLTPLLQKRGWWGRRSMVDPQTGEQKIVQLGSPRRLRTIFEVNMRSAYAAGKWERAQRVKAGFPFLRYVTAGDSRVRPQHRAWDGVIRPIDDPFWETHFPPCGWNCRCTAVPVSKSMLERRGWAVTDDPPSFPKESYTNPRTGEIVPIEEGIDPGFNFNIGKAYLDSLVPRPIGPPSATASASAADEAAAAFLEAFGIDDQAPQLQRSKIFFDRAGWPLAIGIAWFRSLAGKPVIPGLVPVGAARTLLGRVGGTIVKPDVIRQVWITGEDGEPMLVRRYVRGSGRDAVMVDVGRGGWRFATPGDPDFDPAQLDDGEQSWPPSSQTRRSRR